MTSQVPQQVLAWVQVREQGGQAFHQGSWVLRPRSTSQRDWGGRDRAGGVPTHPCAEKSYTYPLWKVLGCFLCLVGQYWTRGRRGQHGAEPHKCSVAGRHTWPRTTYQAWGICKELKILVKYQQYETIKDTKVWALDCATEVPTTEPWGSTGILVILQNPHKDFCFWWYCGLDILVGEGWVGTIQTNLLI